MSLAASAPSAALVTFWAPKSQAAEAFRILRTNLQFLGLDRPLKSLVVTSATMSEGKSFTAANLAVAYAQAGSRVCLVDADLRRPALAALFGEENFTGLTTALMKEPPARNVVVAAGIDGLDVVLSGPIPPNPAEMLGSSRMNALIDELERDYDLVIYDTPPVLAVADPAILAPRTAGVVLVVRAGTVGRDEARRAVEALTGVKAKVLGVVIDGFKPQVTRKYGHYYDRYYSAYESGSEQ